MKIFDAIIIGTGQAGVPLSVALANKGWKVAVVERSYLGGSCINYGCTPTKAMVASARRAYVSKNSSNHGVTSNKVTVNLKKIIARKNVIVKSFRKGIERRLTHKNITLYSAHGRFVDTYKIKVGKEIIQGKRIFINTGMRPNIAPIEGLEKVPYLTSTSIMDLTVVPKHLVVLGGGYIGLEFGQMFARFGSKVTIVQRENQLAIQEDPDIAQEIQKMFEREGIKVMLGRETTKVVSSKKTITLYIRQKGTKATHHISGSHMLIATGRRPNTDDLDMDKAGLHYDKRGFIKTNNKLETNVKHIWVLGDIKGGPAFTHVSWDDHRILLGNLFQKKKKTIEDRPLLYAMFIDPSLGRVGLNEIQAKKLKIPYTVAEYPMSYVARAIEMDETQGKMKLVVHKKTGKILGGAVFGHEGAETIHYIYAFMKAKRRIEIWQIL